MSAPLALLPIIIYLYIFRFDAPKSLAQNAESSS
jgi:hypothetical protein